MSINPNSAYDAVFKYADLSNEKQYTKFILGASFENFRHIPSLALEFNFPVTVIAGSNRSGKTTVLLSIACSHFDFNKRNYTNGKLERQTWSDVLKFTPHDAQTADWKYSLKIKTGKKVEIKHGARKNATKKWSGLGKKESQIKKANVVFLDLDRILPARHHSPVLHKKAKAATAVAVTTHKKNQDFINECLSYILEESYQLEKLADHLGRDLLGFSTNKKYSSYNSASGEDVLSRILIDCIEAPINSLILVDELELGLHPKVQRRLMDVIFEISREHQKQFIITSHSSTIISCVPDKARIFIEANNGISKSISPISINAALSKMDSDSYPVLDVFCEDETASWIISKALKAIDAKNLSGLNSKLINIIISGSADITFQNFQSRQRIFDKVKIKSGHACILDGDMRANKSKTGGLLYPPQDGLFFLPGNVPPEKYLCNLYEKAHPNTSFRFHIENSNVHCLFDKMIQYCGATDKRDAFEICWTHFASTSSGPQELDNIVSFLENMCRYYSPSL